MHLRIIKKSKFMKLNVKIIVFLSIITNTIYCFPQKAWIVKRDCTQKYLNCEYKGFTLDIYFLRANDTIKSSSYWETNPFLDFTDYEKLIIIQQLLTFENDTSLWCGPAAAHFYGGALECRCLLDSVINVPIQIDALYRINGIAFPNICWIYSCYPVLFDTIDKKVINEKPELIKEVYKKYREWLSKCMQKGMISDYFPFNEGRYVWYGGRKSYYPKNE